MVALLLFALLVLLGSGRYGTNHESSGILDQVFQRLGGGRTPKSPPG